MVTIMISYGSKDNKHAVEYNGSLINEAFTPKLARSIVESSGQQNATITRCSVSQSGDTWITRYRVTPKTCRRLYNDFG